MGPLPHSPAPRRRARAFSFVEILIALAIVLVLAGLAVPILRGMTLAANGQSAVEALKAIRDFQVAFKEKGLETGVGGVARFGTFRELMASGFALEDAEQRDSGRALLRHGYLFRMYFATKTGGLILDPAGPDILDSRDGFVLYAWPEIYGTSGVSCFALDPAGRLRVLPGGGVLESRNLAHRYSGLEHGPQPFAARLVSASRALPDSSAASIAPGSPGESKTLLAPGEDGDLWDVVPFTAR
ncbi:MAG: type II secretion system protein [Planctomycetes bacterium]|nr:type II secretion system protein [Planctomycetota bacterium]